MVVQCILSHSLQILNMLVCVPAGLLSIQLPTDVSGKAVVDGSRA